MSQEIPYDENHGTRIKGHWVSFKFVKEKFPFVYCCDNPWSFGNKTSNPKPLLYNLLKPLFDALQKSKIIVNDNQICELDAKIDDESFFEGISLILTKF